MQGQGEPPTKLRHCIFREIASEANPSGEHVAEDEKDGVVANEPATLKGTRHFGQIHRADSYQNANSKAADKPSRLEHSTESALAPGERIGDVLERVRSALESAPKHREESAELDVPLPPKELARPHNKQSPDSTSGTEDTIRSGDGRRGDIFIAGTLGVGREVEIRVPPWLTDRAGDDGSAVPVSLYTRDVQHCTNAA